MGIVSAVVCAAALTTILVLMLAEGGLDQGDQIASIASMVIAGISLPITVYTAYAAIRQERRTVSTAGPVDRFDAIMDAIADAVRLQWEAEEQIRHVHDPFPLPVRWRNAEDDLADHWQNIKGTPDDGDPLVLDGQGDHVVDVFRRVPSGRVVVLGEAGAGKTILTSRFVLTLLDERVDNTVPVIFALGSWDPTRSSLRDWLTEQLIVNYPVLAQVDDSDVTLAARLQATRRILPVLDGLDEVTEGLRGDVIARINEGMRPGDRYLLTSRPREFREAVEATDVLTAAAVVRLEGLTVDDLNRYLPLTTRKTRGAGTKWQPVLDHVAETRGPLFEVLSTPLMVALARTMFSDTEADPAELLSVRGEDSAATREAIEHRLLAGFVPAAYTGAGADRAEDRLRFLARHLSRLETHDIAWWRLVQAVPRTVVGIICGLALATASFLAAGFAGWMGHWPDSGAQRAWLITCVVAGAICGVAGGVVVGYGRGVRLSPARIHLRVRGRLGHILGQLAPSVWSWGTKLWHVGWIGGGLAFGLGAFAFGRDESVILAGLGAGLFAGFGAWLVLALIRALGTPIDPTDITSPGEVLRTDRNTALWQGLFGATCASVVFWLMLRFTFEPAFGVPFDIAFAGGLWFLGVLTTAVLGVLVWMLFVTAWGPWLLARLWLSLTGRLPWSVMSFLADAHRRGVLRQAGGVYQFRHARLRDYLAENRRS